MKFSREYRLVSEIAAPIPNAVIGGPFGSNLVSKDYMNEGIPVIRGTNLSNGRWVAGDFVFVSAEKAAQLSANISRPGDIVFTQRGTLGQVAIVPDQPYDRYVVSQSQMKLTVDPNKADKFYVYYYFLSAEYLQYLDRHTIQTGVPHTNLKILRDTPIPLPPLPVQRRIGGILGRLDDKIEVNRRINRTLKAMAQALYKHWFVDFGPFQDGEFVESELGLIPQGWRAGKLGELGQNTKRIVEPKNVDPETPYIGLADMPKGSIGLESWSLSEDSISAKHEMRKGEILFGKLRPYFKKVGVAPIDGICSTDIIVITPKRKEFFGLLLIQLIQQEFIDYTEAVSDGTRMPRVSWQMMEKYPIVIPADQVIQQFNSLLQVWTKLITDNINENRKLAEIRDYLLPKLLSGEIPVEAATEQVEDVTTNQPQQLSLNM